VAARKGREKKFQASLFPGPARIHSRKKSLLAKATKFLVRFSWRAQQERKKDSTESLGWGKRQGEGWTSEKNSLAAYPKVAGKGSERATRCGIQRGGISRPASATWIRRGEPYSQKTEGGEGGMVENVWGKERDRRKKNART